MQNYKNLISEGIIERNILKQHAENLEKMNQDKEQHIKALLERLEESQRIIEMRKHWSVKKLINNGLTNLCKITKLVSKGI